MLGKKTFIELALVFTVFFFGCKKDNVVDTKPVKDPRTYNWTADTLGYPGSYQTLMNDIWGSSHNDVYVVGHNSQNRGLMWHYDGNSWTSVRLITSEGGQIDGAIDLTSIYGFSSTDIYAAGSRIVGYNPNPPPTFIDSNLIIHYDGSTWKRVNTYNGRIVDDIYGISSTDIWAGGYQNTLYHYNGRTWIKDSVNITVPANYNFQVSSISSYNSNFYAIANSDDNAGHSINFLLKKINGTWVVKDSSYVGSGNEAFGWVLNKSKTNSLYSMGRGVFKYNGTSWDNIFKNTSSFISSMWGSSDDNIFIAGNANGVVFHFNGTDWKQIEQLSNAQIDYFGVWTDGTEAFVVGHIYDGVYMKTIVWHGK